MSNNTMIQAAALIAEQLPRGIFLCVGGETPNVMTIAWGGLAEYWGKHVFVAPVRPQRFTYPLLAKERTFTICVPPVGQMIKEVAQAGTLSGRDGDKFKAIGLKTQPGRMVNAPVIQGSALVLECRVLAENAFSRALMDPATVNAIYPKDDFHTLFYGDIVASYSGDTL